MLPDFPHNSRGFSKRELEVAQLRMTEDVGAKDETKVSNWKALRMALLDYKRESRSVDSVISPRPALTSL